MWVSRQGRLAPRPGPDGKLALASSEDGERAAFMPAVFGSLVTMALQPLMDSLGEPCDDLTELTHLMKFGKSNPMKTGEFSRVTGVPMLLHLQQDRISVAVK